MGVVKFLSKGSNKTSVLGIGVFDGFHKGHQYLAKQCDSLLSFYPHPSAVLKKVSEIKLLTTLEERLHYFPNLFSIDFTPEFASISAETFLKMVVLEQIKPEKCIIGYDFKFGKDRLGNIQMLERWGEENNVEIEIIEPISSSDEIVKSSKIRTYLNDGYFDRAIGLLGHSYLIMGKVIKGEQRGRKMGFPTANIAVPDEKLIPDCGVYKGKIRVQGQSYLSAVYIGKKPTFGVYHKQIEAHILNFNESIYDEKVSLELTGKIRSEMKFDSSEDLISQIKNDVAAV